MILMLLVSTLSSICFQVTIIDCPLMERDSQYRFRSSNAYLSFHRSVKLHNRSLKRPQLTISVATHPGPLAASLGWPCEFTPPDRAYRYLYSISGYLSATRSLSEYSAFDKGNGEVVNSASVHLIVAIVLGMVTLVIRYRKQNNNLLRVIKREGGFYLALTLGDVSFHP